MDDKRILEAACASVGADPERVIKWRVEDDTVVLIVNNGIAGSPKYSVPLPEEEEEAEPEVEEAPEEVEEVPEPEPVDATDGAFKLADELGVDLRDIQGSGVGGRVTVGDVRKQVK